MKRGGAYEFSISATAWSLNSSLKMQLFTVFSLSALWLPASMIKGGKKKKAKLQMRGISWGDGVGGEKGISLRLLLLKDKIIQINCL